MPIEGRWFSSASLPVAASMEKALTAPVGLPSNSCLVHREQQAAPDVHLEERGLGVSAARPSGTRVMFWETSRFGVCRRKT